MFKKSLMGLVLSGILLFSAEQGYFSDKEMRDLAIKQLYVESNQTKTKFSEKEIQQKIKDISDKVGKNYGMVLYMNATKLLYDKHKDEANQKLAEKQKNNQNYEEAANEAFLELLDEYEDEFSQILVKEVRKTDTSKIIKHASDETIADALVNLMDDKTNFTQKELER